MLKMFATTVQAELNATLHVCESGLQDIRIFLGLVPKESSCTTGHGQKNIRLPESPPKGKKVKWHKH
jgi:hypothetical protein